MVWTPRRAGVEGEANHGLVGVVRGPRDARGLKEHWRGFPLTTAVDPATRGG